MGLFNWLKKIGTCSSRPDSSSASRAEENSPVVKDEHPSADAAASSVNEQNAVGKYKGGFSVYRNNFKCRPSNMVINIEGDYEKKPVYTYVGSALKDLHKGQYFYADVVKGPLELVSELNGAVWQIEADCTALAYKGRPFGSFSFSSRTLIRFIDLGCKVRIKCQHTGWYEKPIPEIIMQLPNMGQLWDWSDACMGLGRVIPFEECYSGEAKIAAEKVYRHRQAEKVAGYPLKEWADRITICRDAEAWNGTRPTRAGDVCASVRLIPTPVGSKAQPHVLISLGDEMTLDVSARSGTIYKKLRQRLDVPISFARITKLEEPDERLCWCLTLVYEGLSE